MRKFFMAFAFSAFAVTATVAAISVSVTPAQACDLDICHW
jgi:hypothetical protein